MSQMRYIDVPGFAGYAVGTDGSVWSCRIGGKGKIRTRSVWKKLKPRSVSGYLSVTFSICGSTTAVLVHRVVLEAFKGPCPEGMECRHLDGDRRNNDLDNLCWDTRKNNAADRIKHGTQTRGTLCPGSKATDEMVREMRALYDAGKYSQHQLSRQFGMKRPTVQRIVTRSTWKHVL